LALLLAALVMAWPSATDCGARAGEIAPGGESLARLYDGL
jgi:hypothetical protein